MTSLDYTYGEASSMDLNTVDGLVTALVSAYNDGLDFYTKWQRRKWQENNYARHRKARQTSSGCCGLSTSLSFSAPRIRETFETGADLLGDGFSVGDETCRAALASNLRQLRMRVHVLWDAMEGGSAPLALFTIIRTSEDVRVSTLRALGEQYQRVAIGRPVPKELPMPSRRSRASILLPDDIISSWKAIVADSQPSRLSSPRRSRFLTLPMDTIVDDIETPISADSRRSACLSGLPSPPPTPTRADDLQWRRSIRSSVSSRSVRNSIASTGFRPRPASSVFGLFCPEAMRYQLDHTRNMSGTGNRVCKCGHDLTFYPTDKHSATKLKDGFEMTPRFLAKSHYVETGFGCVLCIMSGTMGTYEDIASLRDHINAAHDKWQMIHDRDMTAR
ncbi:hypothetical protein AB5N19_11411 [Seiridium cardinale]